jgi:hypothetical protein
MYLFRELDILPLLVLLALWGVGGWLVTLRVFDLEPRHRSFIGCAVGLVLANWCANFLARVLPPSLAFWASALIVLVLGIAFAWPLKRDLFAGFGSNWGDWILFAIAVFILTLIGRGLGLFDDFQNLPAVSVMAAGDIPPHLPAAPLERFGYHYFLLLLSVQFMHVGNAAPWTSLDLARGLTLAMALVLAGMLGWRLTHNRVVAWMSALFVAFATGTRWLLLFVPVSFLERISNSVTLIGSGRDSAATLSEAITLPWRLAGDGPLPFPFAFANGINGAWTMSHNGYGVSAHLILLALVLLTAHRRDWKSGLVISILLANLALANEIEFGAVYLGFVLVVLYWVLTSRTLRLPRSIWYWVIVAAAGGLLAATQGGMITELIRARFIPSAAQGGTYFEIGFSLVPPQVISSHLGKLSLLNPLQLLTALFEMGPILLVLPLALAWGIRALREEKWLEAALVASAVPSLLSIFLEYRGNAGITATTRLLSNFFFVCEVFAVPLVYLWLRQKQEWLRSLSYGLGLVTVFGGLVLFGIQMIAIPRPVYSYFLTDMDARFYESYWDRLTPPGAWVFDPNPSRAPTLFGRPTNALINWGVATPEWEALLARPDPYLLKAAGYDYIYTDKDYWKEHAEELNISCVEILETIEGSKLLYGGEVPDFRRLARISECE